MARRTTRLAEKVGPLPRHAASGLGLNLAVAAAFGVGASLAVAGFAPARWLAQAVAEATDGKLQLPNARGTLWQGQADVLLTGGTDSQDRAALPGGLQWTLSPTWLSSAGGSPPAPGGVDAIKGPALAVHLHAPCCTTDGSLVVWLQPSWGGLTVGIPAHSSQWPATLLTGLGTPWNTLQLQGTLALQTAGFTLDLSRQRWASQGSASLNVHNASSRLASLNPMGSYRLQWDSGVRSDDARLKLSTLSGALQLKGEGQWVAGRLRFAGDAQASPGREEALANLLNILGRRQGPRTLIKIG
jgi:general secretion pathway protein N